MDEEDDRSLAEIEAEIRRLGELYDRRLAAQAGADEERRKRIAATVGAYDNMIGESTQPPYDPERWEQELKKPEAERDWSLRPTIRAVRKHNRATLEAFHGMALELILEAVELNAVMSRDVARLVGQ